MLLQINLSLFCHLITNFSSILYCLSIHWTHFCLFIEKSKLLILIAKIEILIFCICIMIYVSICMYILPLHFAIFIIFFILSIVLEMLYDAFNFNSSLYIFFNKSNKVIFDVGFWWTYTHHPGSQGKCTLLYFWCGASSPSEQEFVRDKCCFWSTCHPTAKLVPSDGILSHSGKS